MINEQNSVENYIRDLLCGRPLDGRKDITYARRY